ncbi:hypothetical protein A3860_17330 [Niastella vici]|uniref:Uncharacterized protein n=1 Tax=Niastella vici TaxID=1703345 RepID=A0A1V9G4N6_9BACT|nr:hypothetical protein A3860_17330 [Niastella vici]
MQDRNGADVLKQMNKIFEDILKPESTEEHLPYELTQELRTKRKQSHRQKFILCQIKTQFSKDS